MMPTMSSQETCARWNSSEACSTPFCSRSYRAGFTFWMISAGSDATAPVAALITLLIRLEKEPFRPFSCSSTDRLISKLPHIRSVFHTTAPPSSRVVSRLLAERVTGSPPPKR